MSEEVKKRLTVKLTNGREIVLEHPPRTWQFEDNGYLTIGRVGGASLRGLPRERIKSWKQEDVECS